MTFDDWYATQKHRLSNEQVCRMIWDAATKTERDACVNVCAGVRGKEVSGGNDWYLEGRQMGATICMNAINMRSNVQGKGLATADSDKGETA